jgi:hypothetical protein
MTERASPFREEALEFQAGGPGQGVLRIDPPWTGWLYWIVLALVVTGLVGTATARTSETTSGPALVNVQERTFVALVPDAAAPELHGGQLVRVQLNGPNGPVLAGRVVRAEVADQAGIRRAGFASSSQPAMLVTGVLAPDADLAPVRPPGARHDGRAVVVLGSQTVLDLFLRQLRGALGRGGDS